MLLLLNINQLVFASNSPKDCAKIESDEKRLACYDDIFRAVKKAKKVEKLESVESSRPQEQVRAKQISQSEIEEFGAEKIAKPIADNSPTEITSKVTKIVADSRGFRIFTLNTGQVWKEKEKSRLKVDEGDQVIVEKGFLSSYFLSTPDSNRRSKVTRIK